MTTHADILDFFTKRFTTCELPRKKAFLLLRWTLFASLLGLGITSSQEILSISLINLTLVIFLIVNLVLSFFPHHAFHSTPLEFSLGLLDTALICYVVYASDHTGYLGLFFFLLLINTAVSSRLTQILFGALTFSALYLLVSGIQSGVSIFLSVPHLMIIPLFFAISLYLGYQVLQIRDRHAASDDVYRERQELRIVLNILESITSSLDFHDVMFRIASRIADVVDTVRCSILLVEEGEMQRGFVVASNDDQNIDMLPVDLSKYPEVQSAILSKDTVIIEDIEKSNLLRPVVQDLLKLHFRSLMVLPILYQDSVIGTLFLRAARKSSFTQDEVKFCRVVASAAASAIKNSMLYRSLQEHAAEQEKTAARMSILLDNSPDLIVHLDMEGSIVLANRTAERLSGRSLSEILSLDLGSLIRGLRPPRVLMEKALVAKVPLVYDAKLIAAGNRERDLSVTVGATGEPGGGLILIGRDVTEQKQATAMLHQAEKLSTIGEIVASVAHELNNPLMGVLGFSELLARKDTKGKFKRDIEHIIDASYRCKKVVENLLSFSRPSNPEKKPLGLNGVMVKTLDLLEHFLRGHNIEVVTDLSPELPYVLADFHQIQQVFTNLINNAHQAMSDQEEQGRLLLRSYMRDGQVVVDVTDNGPGIPPETLPNIFDPFFSTKELGKGTGLGLSISYGIVRDHGGQLLVDSRLGLGTTFSTVFPVASVGESEMAGGKPGAMSRNAAKSVLVVDDENIIVDLYVELLNGLGLNVDTASSGLEAIKKIEGRDYDLIISDVKMPKMNGLQLYEKAIAQKPEMRHRFVFVTGSTNAPMSLKFSSAMDIPCFMKPLNIEKIEKIILRMVGEEKSPSEAFA